MGLLLLLSYQNNVEIYAKLYVQNLTRTYRKQNLKSSFFNHIHKKCKATKIPEHNIGKGNTESE